MEQGAGKAAKQAGRACGGWITPWRKLAARPASMTNAASLSACGVVCGGSSQGATASATRQVRQSKMIAIRSFAIIVSRLVFGLCKLQQIHEQKIWLHLKSCAGRSNLRVQTNLSALFP
jgi:hypothetical protein